MKGIILILFFNYYLAPNKDDNTIDFGVYISLTVGDLDDDIEKEQEEETYYNVEEGRQFVGMRSPDLYSVQELIEPKLKIQIHSRTTQ